MLNLNKKTSAYSSAKKLTVLTITFLMIAAMIIPAALASSVDVAVVDITAPTGSVTLSPGTSGSITIDISVTGKQEGTATFTVNRGWILSGGTFVGSNPQTFTVSPRAASDPPTTFSTSGIVTVAAEQSAGIFTLAVSAINITNTNLQGAKLSNGRVSNYQVIVVIPDTTPPVITPTITGTLGNNGWYISDVTVTWTATDAESSITSTSGTNPVTINYDTKGVTVSFSATSAGGTSTDSVTIKRDTTKPTISYTRTAANGYGWNNGPVTVTFSGDDLTSGVASITGSTTVSSEGENQQVTGIVYDNAGNYATSTANEINIDLTSPSITVSQNPLANSFGWNNQSVEVSFSATDALSGIDTISPSSQILNAEGEGVTVSCTATDKAGNSKTVISDGVNIDLTSPTISGAATTSPNSNGWYNDDVTIHFTVDDALSGINPSTIPADVTLTSEGQNIAVTRTVQDKAGNQASATVSGINIDTTKPNTQLQVTGTLGNNNWYRSDVTVELLSVDAGSGVDKTYYTLNGGTQQVYSGSFVINVEGTNTLEYWTVDKAGNTESAYTVTIKIDKAAPTITGSRTPLANSYGWNNEDVTVKFTVADDVSGIASAPSDQVVSSEGEGQSVTGTVYDDAGNFASATVDNINIDKTLPSISYTRTSPNSYGWNKEDVVVAFDGEDLLSGVASVEGSTTISTEGAGQTVTGTVTDKAGNSVSVTVQNINIDKTAPLINGYTTTSSNEHGWYEDDVTVQFDYSDALSGISDGTSSKQITITTEGASQSRSVTVYDKAGNSATSTVSGINIDKTKPAISVTGPLNYGVYAIGYSLTFTATDSLSGVDYYRGQLTTSETTIPVSSGYQPAAGVYSLSIEAKDKAGNIEQSDPIFFVIYDPSAGFVTGGGWIDSPTGAYSSNPQLSGKATFGFVSKYLKGANVPTGNTEFIFHIADMKFKSTSYEWLVVSGSTAQFKGTGTINGLGDYKFQLFAGDGGKLGPDSFRIKIWDAITEAVVYDNGVNQAILGGSIVIHK